LGELELLLLDVLELDVELELEPGLELELELDVELELELELLLEVLLLLRFTREPQSATMRTRSSGTSFGSFCSCLSTST
jgi:hypothetical protein